MKLHLTKYKNNSSNYFDNTYTCIGNSGGFQDYFSYIFKPSLINLPEGYTKYYYKYEVINNVAYFKIYTDSGHTNEISNGINVDIIPNGIDGKSYLFHLTNDFGIVVIYKQNDVITGLNQSGYFEVNTVIDYFTIENLPIDVISSYSEELINSNLEYVASDFNFRLSNIIPERSHLGKTVFEFFKDNEGYCFRVILENGTDRKVSFVDYSSIEYNLNNTNDGETISFTSFSAEKELRDFGNTKKFFEVGYRLLSFWNSADTFNQLMDKFAKGLNTNIDYGVNIDDIVYSVHNQYPRITYCTTYFDSENYWDMFLNICKSYGILFKIEVNNFNVDKYDVFNLKIFFRDSGLLNDLQIIEEIEQNKGLNDKYLWGVNLGTLTNKVIPDSEMRFAYMSQDNSTFPYFLSPDDNKWRSFVNFMTGGQPISDWAINWIEIKPLHKTEIGNNLYVFENDTDFVFTSISPSMIFSTDYNISNSSKVLTTILENRYDFLNSGLKRTKTLKIVYNSNINLSLYDRFNYDNTEWYIERITNIDLISETAEIEITEI